MDRRARVLCMADWLCVCLKTASGDGFQWHSEGVAIYKAPRRPASRQSSFVRRSRSLVHRGSTAEKGLVACRNPGRREAELKPWKLRPMLPRLSYLTRIFCITVKFGQRVRGHAGSPAGRAASSARRRRAGPGPAGGPRLREVPSTVLYCHRGGPYY